jgi:hypothetical protein
MKEAVATFLRRKRLFNIKIIVESLFIVVINVMDLSKTGKDMLVLLIGPSKV